MRWTWIILGTVAATLALTPAAHAASFTVTATTDGGGSCTGSECPSIRAALAAAAGTSESDTITLPAGTYELASALAIDTAVTLQGASARTTIIRPSSATRALDITAAATISHLTVSSGTAQGDFGGNIRSRGATVTLDHVRVTGGNASTGAGIANLHGTMTIENSLIDANTGQTQGGGIANLGDADLGSASLSLRNTTVAFNTANFAGGILNIGSNFNAMTLQSVTVARNSAGAGGTGGMYTETGTLAVGSTIVADNTATSGATNCSGVPASSQGWNVEPAQQCGFTQEPDVRNAGDVRLATALVNAGGETDILPPLVDSVAVNLKQQSCEAADQLGVLRPQGPACDAGAVELTYPVRIDSGPPPTTTQTSVQLTFSSTMSSDSFECGLGGPSAPTYTPCESPITYDTLAEGSHTFHVRAIENGASIGEATREFTVDTVAPTVTITSIPGPLTNQFTFDIEFTASEPGVTFECKHFWPDDPEPEVGTCTSPWPFRELPDGKHRFEITATDLAGNTGPPASGEVTIDSVAPDPVEPSPVDATTFAFTPAEQGAAFECRLEGPAGDSGFQPCSSPKAYPDLAPGDYRFTLRTLDAAGNHADATPRAFSVAPTPVAAVSPTPSPTPTPSVTPPPPPTPEIAKTVVVRPVSGKILVRVPGSDQFVELDATKGLPVGTEINAKNGRIQLTSEPAQGKPVQKSVFYGGIFTIAQGSDGFVELKLSEKLAPCPKKKQARAAAKDPKTRKLWGDGKGKFRTRGQYSSATVRGTKWLVQDSCDGTLTKVANGVVSVRDFGAKKTVLVRGGRSYLARPKR